MHFSKGHNYRPHTQGIHVIKILNKRTRVGGNTRGKRDACAACCLFTLVILGVKDEKWVRREIAIATVQAASHLASQTFHVQCTEVTQ